jgi:SAM-dependent methyltransferase
MGYRLRGMLGSEYVRSLLFQLRHFYFVRLRRRLRTLDSADSFKMTLPHNLKRVSEWLPRMELLIKPLSVIETVSRSSRVLVIGPRNEYDLILLAANGFGFRSVRGLDLISYSPKIDLGDMHAMPYADSSWDVVLCGWTLSYSATPQKAAAEMLRVIRDGGVIGVGIEYSTMSEEDTIALVGYSIEDHERLPERINSVEQCLELFRPHVNDIFFNHDAPLRISHAATGYTIPSNVAVIFSVTK